MKPSAARARRPRLLLIGPLPSPDVPVGGTQVSFADSIESFRASGTFDIELIDTTRPGVYQRSLRKLLWDAWTFAHVVARVLWRGRRCHAVFFNASADGLLLGAPFVALAARLIRRPVAMRAYGGDFDLVLEVARPVLRRLAGWTTLRADLLLLQTEALCRKFAYAPSVRKLPTTRRPGKPERAPAAGCRRFLFLSQLRPEKGIAEAMRAIEQAPEGCSLSVYGSVMPGTSLAVLQGSSRVRYYGEVPFERVRQVLSEHDALVFPSTWPGEGHPGVVIEAMQCGLPVIAARWRALPELVEHGKTGLLVEPRSADALREAMTLLVTDDELYSRLSMGARERGLEHSTDLWHRRLETWLLDLVGRTAGEAPGRDEAGRSDVSPPLPRWQERVGGRIN